MPDFSNSHFEQVGHVPMNDTHIGEYTEWGQQMWPGSQRLYVNGDAFAFAVRVAIAGTINHIESEIPPRWLDSPNGAEQHAAEIAALPAGYCEQLATTAVTALGWHLSILYAQSTGEGMGVGDALDTNHLADVLLDWAHDRIAGRRGINHTDRDSGYDDCPDSEVLAREWLATIRRWAS